MAKSIFIAAAAMSGVVSLGPVVDVDGVFSYRDDDGGDLLSGGLGRPAR
jgi:hypothetical protein